MASIAANVLNPKYEEIYGFGAKDPSTRDPYMSITLENRRTKYYKSAPRFKNDPQLSKLDSYALYEYFRFLGELPKLFTERCPENN